MTKDNFTIPTMSEEEALNLFHSNQTFYKWYQSLEIPFKQEILHFFMGSESLHTTYDPFFRKILNPHIHQNRLESLLSSILGEEIKIVEILQREGSQISESASFVIMDIVVKTRNNAYINVEMQKIGYNFPLNRVDCYTSDLIMRQYCNLKATYQKNFSFYTMAPVTSIVIMEHSPKLFSKDTKHAIHHRYCVFDTGINGKGLSSNYFLCLDIYKKYLHNKINSKLEAWMLFLGSTSIDDIYEVCRKYPEFIPLYQDVFSFRDSLEDFMTVFSEALHVMDKNMERLMVEELQDENEELKTQNAELEKQINELKDLLQTLQKKSSTNKNGQ